MNLNRKILHDHMMLKSIAKLGQLPDHILSKHIKTPMKMDKSLAKKAVLFRLGLFFATQLIWAIVCYIDMPTIFKIIIVGNFIIANIVELFTYFYYERECEDWVPCGFISKTLFYKEEEE